MDGTIVYQEKLTSTRTQALFIGLTLLFMLLFVWRVVTSGWRRLTFTFGGFGLFFLSYALNYRTLSIRLTAATLRLQFGLFKWTIPLDNVESCRLDEVSLWRIGGAGIHFTSIGRRYRAFFNFLEYPRVVIALKQKSGPVRDIVFSTQQPEQIMQLLQVGEFS